MWLMHEGASVNYSLQGKRMLDEIFRVQWTGHGGKLE
jgi:hypothetical protein